MQDYPSSAAAERALLSAVIQRTISPMDTGLTSADFENAGHQAIFKAAAEMEQQGQEIDMVSIIGAIGMDEMVISIATSGEGWSVDLARRHAQIVRENALRRAVSAVLVEASRQLHQPDTTAAGVSLSVCGRLKDVIAGSTSASTRSMLELVLDRLETLDKPEEQEAHIGTGLHALDMLLGGGFVPTNFAVIGARPGAGKSALMLSMAIAASGAGKKVLYISLEMSDEENALRTLSSISGIASRRFAQRGALEPQEGERISDGIAAYSLENIQHYAAAICRVSDVRNLAARMKAQGGLDMVCVDYIGLLRPEQSLGSRVNEISQITRDLKAMAMELGVVVVAAAQLNRDNVKLSRRPVLSDLRESGSIEQDANVVIFVHDDGSAPDEFGSKRCELIVAKNRQGQRGIVNAVFRGSVMRFAEVT